MAAVMLWAITAGTIAGVLFRPREWPEAVWACIGAALLVLFQLISVADAGAAAIKGTDVYLFLAGMMLLADLARSQGVFEWMASLAVSACAGSARRLFSIVYLVGVVVTVFLSNDATAVVLTPAVYAAVRRAAVPALPYLFTCAFVANAASFVLPISNPANLVVYGNQLPPLLVWLSTFALPSVAAILATYFALRWRCRSELSTAVRPHSDPLSLTQDGRLALWSLCVAALALILCSAFGRNLGIPTLVTAIVAVLASTRLNFARVRLIFSEVSWSVIPLVAGLFVIVEALSKAGVARDISAVLAEVAALPPWPGTACTTFVVSVLCNIMNNLPAGLLLGSAVQASHVTPHIRDSVLVGVDLGPNFSVSGSLATILWLIALRREGEKISAWMFLKTGTAVTFPALLLSSLALALTSF